MTTRGWRHRSGVNGSGRGFDSVVMLRGGSDIFGCWFGVLGWAE